MKLKLFARKSRARDDGDDDDPRQRDQKKEQEQRHDQQHRQHRLQQQQQQEQSQEHEKKGDSDGDDDCGSDDDGGGGEGDREERQHTIDLQRSRGFSNADMVTVLLHQQQQLRVERQLLLPEQHPRSNSQESYGQTDREDADSEELASRSDRSTSIDVRRTDAPHFAVGRAVSEGGARSARRDSKSSRRAQSFAFGSSHRR